MPRHFKVHTELDRAELDQLEEFAREPGRTADECHEWLQARGYTMSRTAVVNWKSEFLSNDRFRASADIAQVILTAAKEKGVASVADAASLQAGQMIFEALLKGQETGQLETKELFLLSSSLRNVISGSRTLEALKAETAERQKAAVEAAESAAKAGGSGEAVAAKVRELLGIR